MAPAKRHSRPHHYLETVEVLLHYGSAEGDGAATAEYFVVGVGGNNKYRISHELRLIKALKPAMTYRAFH